MSPGTTHRGDRRPPPASASAARSHLAKPPQGKQRVFLVALHADEQLQTGNASASCTSRLTPAHPWLLPIARMGGPGEPQRLMERGQPAPSIPSAAIPMETLFRFGGGRGELLSQKPCPQDPLGFFPRATGWDLRRCPMANRTGPLARQQAFPLCAVKDEDAAATSCSFPGQAKPPGTPRTPGTTSASG